MEKYGVQINDFDKVASACPDCGGRVDNRYMTPRCERCGTKPWEKSGIDSIIASLKSRYPGKIFESNEYHMPWSLKRLPTGIIDLDIALNGGFPAGGLSFLIGKH